MMPDDDRLARDLAAEADVGSCSCCGRPGGDPSVLRKAANSPSDEFLVGELARLRPGDAVLSEEGRDDHARLSASRVWIVDPLDGTREFGEASWTDWAVHVALWQRGELTAGAVALPRRKALSTAEPGMAAAGAPGSGPSRAADAQAAATALPRNLRFVVSRTRPPAFIQALADQAWRDPAAAWLGRGQGRGRDLRGR